MALKEFEKYTDPEERAWAMIWKVVPVLQKEAPEDEVSTAIVNEISTLRTQGKLSEQQKKVLDVMGLNALFDDDEF